MRPSIYLIYHTCFDICNGTTVLGGEDLWSLMTSLSHSLQHSSSKPEVCSRGYCKTLFKIFTYDFKLSIHMVDKLSQHAIRNLLLFAGVTSKTKFKQLGTKHITNIFSLCSTTFHQKSVNEGLYFHIFPWARHAIQIVFT